MSEFIRSAVKTFVLSAGTAGLLALGGGVASAAAPTADDLTNPLDGMGVSLPGEQLPTDSLPGDLAGNEIVDMSAPVVESEDEPMVSGDLAVLPEGKDTLQVMLDEIEHQSMVHQGEVESLLGGATEQTSTSDTVGSVTGSAPGVVPQRGAAPAQPAAEDPAKSLGLSTEGLVGKGLLGEGLPL
ncbi:hypothetical protein NI17_019025 [Thermobifida halotolerans]|uniref:Uncharacterized protein n=1 Tax=Thermobifida halotolerans TaxID=483545 RepID=A0A399FV21_9ACTN|nr:hypothetical protein [Thermobifida halotolerans]UOE18846.1 hypothetical protein NI17_019025 [Thermobifida halotolerans]